MLNIFFLEVTHTKLAKGEIANIIAEFSIENFI